MIDLIREKLRSYDPVNRLEEESAAKEILQEIALYGLSRAGFFERAVFQGGTCLRIVHGLPRFSEDLDFMLLASDRRFDWSPYLHQLLETFERFGITPDVRSKGAMDRRIRSAVIKDSSIAGQLELKFADRRPDWKINIKLEIDVEPPAHSQDAWTFLDFPGDYEVRHQDLSSNMALKVHALLCRGFLKGRDWFDFSWYVSKGSTPNLTHLQSALMQHGPWAGHEDLRVDIGWLERELRRKIGSVNWSEARSDVHRFLRGDDQKSLELWSERFFVAKLEKLIRQASPSMP